ncbi:ABC transporter ATP-binding protein [Aestuariispira insulae]|uniref:Iron complex transport system ATP-binding protein n=1 Tax=Aestuariispira insulae TaxID=1461337 RepID=A0A3D9H5Y3_9PROT|nr:ABC transporter ATP-binding protein [Aestuariispira insulae]RED44849.1 iron complex transport system ATP-binding protein [Aestuariispira insulae]
MTITCDALVAGYGEQKVLKGLSLALSPGAINVLIGPNGCGKSTLLRTAAGLLKPVSGEVQLDNKPIGQWPRRKLARQISFLPQAPVVPENMTVAQLVEQGRFAHRGLLGGMRGEDRDAVDWALEQTGLTAFRARSVAGLSGGERQRVWIAAALAQQTQIVLLDEPTTYLDIGHQLEVLELLQDLSRNRALTVLISLHEISHALMFGDRIFLMENGHLRFEGSPAALAETDLLQTVFAVEGSFRRLDRGVLAFLGERSRGRDAPGVTLAAE